MTMTTSSSGPDLLSKRFYVFALPSEILDVLTLRTVQQSLPEAESNENQDEQAEEVTATGLGCQTCAIGAFDSVTEQRKHFRSDWHRYNLKLKSAKSSSKPLKEDEFDAMADDLEGSISGSESSSDTSSSASSQLANNLQSTNLADQMPTRGPRSPLLWFTAQNLPDTQLGLYRHIFPFDDKKSTLEPAGGWAKALASIQVQPDVPKPNKKELAAMTRHGELPKELPDPTPSESRTWAMFMVGGGHFAAMIVSLVPKMSKQSGKMEREMVVLEHKTYHRYTTRRKQGGAQSKNDASKGNAKSAGAEIRRYNEVALQEDVRALMQSWKKRLDACELVWMRTSKANSKIFYNYDHSPLSRQDPRNRTFPFPTRRPTLAELYRCFDELTKIKTSYLTEDALAALDAAYQAEQAKKLQPKILPSAYTQKEKQPTAPVLSKEEITLRRRWERVVDMARKGRLDALISFTEKHDSTWTEDLPEFVEESTVTPTLLHLASLSGQPQMVRWLLLDCRSDPTKLSPAGKTAYEIAATRSTRNVFRRCMNEHAEWYKWESDARVPSGLTEEQETAEREKGKERKNRFKDKMKEREKEREAERERETAERIKREEAERDRKAVELRAKPTNGPQKLGGAAAGYLKAQAKQQTAGMSEDAKMRLERERRARAAEARMRGP